MNNEELEEQLVKDYMERNGWDFPTDKSDCDDYDIAVKDVKWFMGKIVPVVEQRAKEDRCRSCIHTYERESEDRYHVGN